MASGVGDRPAAARCRLDVAPFDSRVGDGRANRVHSHLHGGLALEPAERVQADPPDDRHIVHAGAHRPSCTGANATGTKSFPVGPPLYGGHVEISGASAVRMGAPPADSVNCRSQL